MVKGCQKRTIHIKDTGSKYYEEAYFVLRPGVSGSKVPDSDMISEAVRIAAESISAGGAGEKNRGGMLSFIIGLLAGGAVSALAAILFLI